MSEACIMETNLPLLILYYCWQQKDSTRYPLSLKGLCELKQDCAEYGTREISNWLCKTYCPPTKTLLSTYDVKTVKLWYKYTYELPTQVQYAQNTIVKLTTEEIHHLAIDSLCDNTLVFNTTTRSWNVYDKKQGQWCTTN
jgi:hypothetical protein